MRRAKAARALSRSGILAALGLSPRWSGVAGVNYHRIGDGSRSLFDRGLWSATAEDFDRHVRYLASHFDLVTPRDLPDVVQKGRGRFVLITFDDGYLDNYDVAFPILKRHGAPATFFITTGFLDSPRLSWWDEIAWMVRSSTKTALDGAPGLPAAVVFDEPDREAAVCAVLRAYKSLPTIETGAFLDDLAEATGSGRFQDSCGPCCWMDWDMVREMQRAGMVIGGHTAQHPVLSRLPAAQQCEEIDTCSRRLAEELGEPMRYFSYPVGERFAFSDETRACLRNAGVRYAFSYYGGIRSFAAWDDLDIQRMAVESYMDFDWFRATLTLPSIFGQTTVQLRPSASRLFARRQRG